MLVPGVTRVKQAMLFYEYGLCLCGGIEIVKEQRRGDDSHWADRERNNGFSCSQVTFLPA